MAEGRAVGVELATLAAWLEDVHSCAARGRARALREGASGGRRRGVGRALAAYLKELQCPYEASLAFGDDTGRYVLASWLLGTAVAYEYGTVPRSSTPPPRVQQKRTRAPRAMVLHRFAERRDPGGGVGACGGARRQACARRTAVGC